ncbi:Serine/threonine-protein kinase rio2 [Tilletia horrida]|uniref:Serine/threonine-protein kinase RIO2 n=1 Tax=Tilletia horrida TaxID=155126 RepID=A0AAN6JJU9_9BASI|nr:Serine/threonine-protein kinase rio2 [Tilletia horrida]KAK0562579.1 Serine/threonine-protein kinase rio2 [Tilletia horrida]
MKLDASDIRYIDEEQWRVLRAVEQGSRNHQVVPTPLITSLAHLHHAGINKLIGALARRNLVSRVQNAAYDGYRLTYGGLDFLALRTLVKNDAVHAVGQQVGVGKESDIYIVTGPSLTDGEPEKRILKMHRLGRISFRNVKEKRDYLGKRKTSSWMYLSKLAAAKEIAFMQILHDHGFPVPRPFAQARHCLVMELIDAYPLRQVASIPANQLGPLYSALMKLIVRLARAGLIHGDFNEFNLLVREIHDEGVNAEYEEGYGPDGPISRIVVGDAPAPPAAAQSEANGATDTNESEQEEDDDDEDLDDGIYIDEGVRVEPILIDFPQMMSVEHANAKFFFDRDVACVQRFFRKRFRYLSSEAPPRFEDVVPPSRRVKDGPGLSQSDDFYQRSKVDGDASEDEEQDVAPGVFYQAGPASGAMAGEEDIASRFVLGVGNRRQKGKGERMGRKKREGAEEQDGGEGDEQSGDKEDEEGSDEEDTEEDEDEDEDEDDPEAEEAHLDAAAQEVEEEDEDDLDPQLGPRLRLDALVNATGYGNVTGKRKDKKGKGASRQDDHALEEFMSRMRMQDPRERQRASEDDDDDEEGDDDNHGGDQPSSLHVSARNRHASSRSKPNDVASRVAQERVRSRAKDAKHHGAKSLASRTGRRHAGGKAKADAVRDSAVF